MVLEFLTSTSTCTDAVAFSSSHFGAGTGAVYLDNVECTGSETNLTDCSQSSTDNCTCGHSEDAGVRCQGCVDLTLDNRNVVNACHFFSLTYSYIHWKLYLW